MPCARSLAMPQTSGGQLGQRPEIHADHNAPENRMQDIEVAVFRKGTELREKGLQRARMLLMFNHRAMHW